MRDIVATSDPSSGEKYIGQGKASPHVLRIDWKLPARLRRPIRQEIKKQRVKQRRDEAIVRFERRSINSDVPSTLPVYRKASSTSKNYGTQDHTADVYMHSRPVGKNMLPPHVGGFIKRSVAPALQGRIQPQKGYISDWKNNANQTASTIEQIPEALIVGERDAPYDWHAQTPAAPDQQTPPLIIEGSLGQLTEPKKRFFFPLHFSFSPLNLFGGRRNLSQPGHFHRDLEKTKKKLRQPLV